MNTFFIVYPTLLGIIAGHVVMLFMTKVQKPWSLFIFGIITPLIMVVMGQHLCSNNTCFNYYDYF